jgi:uncharacterized membrane protein
MKTFSIEDAVFESWGIFKNNKKVLILATLVLLLAQIVLGGSGSKFNYTPGQEISSFFSNMDMGSFVLYLLVAAVVIFLSAGYFKILLKINDNVPTSAKEIFQHTELFWKYAGVTIVFFLMRMVIPIVTVLFMLLSIYSLYFIFALPVAIFVSIVLVFYFFLKFGFALILVVDKGLGPIQALKESSLLTHGVKWKLIFFTIAVGFINLLGLLCLGVGILVSWPVSMLAYVHVYRFLSRAPVVVENAG